MMLCMQAKLLFHMLSPVLPLPKGILSGFRRHTLFVGWGHGDISSACTKSKMSEADGDVAVTKWGTSLPGEPDE